MMGGTFSRLLRAHTNFYNPRDNHYKNRGERQRAWGEIGMEDMI